MNFMEIRLAKLFTHAGVFTSIFLFLAEITLLEHSREEGRVTELVTDLSTDVERTAEHINTG